MKSIRGQLLAGLGVVGAVSAVVLTLAMAVQYGMFSAYPPPFAFVRKEFTDHVLLPLGVLVSLAVVGAVIVVRIVARQLRTAAEAADRAAQRGDSFTAPVESLPLEVRPFAAAVNALTARLEDQARRQESFAADAAHELKTPLAILALEMDSLPQEQAAPLRAQVRALSDLIDQLLLLARSNAPEGAARQARIDPAAACRRLVAEMAPRAIQQGRSLAFEDRGAAPVAGLEEAVVSAVRTLVVNALRVTPEGGEVVVAAGPGPIVAVLDGGPGLDADTLEGLKARGVRADHAAPEGAGLGLAIADRIAEAHGGELETCMPDRPGLRLRFPAAKR